MFYFKFWINYLRVTCTGCLISTKVLNLQCLNHLIIEEKLFLNIIIVKKCGYTNLVHFWKMRKINFFEVLLLFIIFISCPSCFIGSFYTFTIVFLVNCFKFWYILYLFRKQFEVWIFSVKILSSFRRVTVKTFLYRPFFLKIRCNNV